MNDLRGLRAARWIRESTRGQYDRFGPDAQREQQDAAIAQYGLVDTGIAWSVAHSGRTVGDTAVFGEMLARAGRDYDLLVVGYVSRFARNLRTAVNARHDLHAAGAALLFCDERILSSDEDAWDQWARETVEAESYSRRLGRNIRSGFAAKRRRHSDYGSGEVSFGFRRVAGLLEPDPDTMPVVQRVFESAAAGATDQAIALHLDLTVWQVRKVLTSPLYAGRLPSGDPTRFPAPIGADLIDRAATQRQRRTFSGHQPGRHRTYPLTDRGPLACQSCGRYLKGAYKTDRQLRVYRHPDKCEAWQRAEYTAADLDDQVAYLLRHARPNRETEAKLRSALRSPVVEPDRFALAQLDAEMRRLALSLVSAPDPSVIARLDELRARRAEVAAAPLEAETPDVDVAIAYLGEIGRLWAETSDEGRRALAVATFARLGAVSGRIVEVETTPYAERRGLALALPTRVTGVGGTGLLREPVTWPVAIVNRREWLRAARSA